jgi:hypothetical protein
MSFEISGNDELPASGVQVKTQMLTFQVLQTAKKKKTQLLLSNINL